MISTFDMKKLFVSLLAAALTLNAQEGPKKPQTGGPDPVPPHLRPERPKLTEEQKQQRAALVQKYDINKNGKLDPEERKNIKEEDRKLLRPPGGRRGPGGPEGPGPGKEKPKHKKD